MVNIVDVVLLSHIYVQSKTLICVVVVVIYIQIKFIALLLFFSYLLLFLLFLQHILTHAHNTMTIFCIIKRHLPTFHFFSLLFLFLFYLSYLTCTCTLHFHITCNFAYIYMCRVVVNGLNK